MGVLLREEEFAWLKVYVEDELPLVYKTTINRQRTDDAASQM